MQDLSRTPSASDLRAEQLADDLTDLKVIRKRLKAALGVAMVNALKSANGVEVLSATALAGDLGDFEAIMEDAIDGLFRVEEKRVK